MDAAGFEKTKKKRKREIMRNGFAFQAYVKRKGISSVYWTLIDSQIVSAMRKIMDIIWKACP